MLSKIYASAKRIGKNINISSREFLIISQRGTEAASIIVLVSPGAIGFIKNKLDKNKIPNIINHKISFVKKYPFIEYFLYNIFFVTYIVINPHTIVIRTTYIINLI